jgi:hypothetical protein
MSPYGKQRTPAHRVAAPAPTRVRLVRAPPMVASCRQDAARRERAFVRDTMTSLHRRRRR